MNFYKSCFFTIWCAASSVAFSAENFDPLEHLSYQTKRVDQTVLLSTAIQEGTLFMAGERGIVIRSQHGDRWQQDQVPVSTTITRIKALHDGLLALAHSGALLELTNVAEQEWKVILDGREIPAIYRHFIENSNLSESDRQMLERELAGYEQQGPDKPFLDAIALEGGRIQVFGAYGMALEMTKNDEGFVFQPITQRFENNPYMHLYDTVRYDGAIYVVGERGTIFRSDDEGLHYTKLESPYEGTFFGASEVNGDLYIYGMKGNLFRKSTAGSWVSVKVGTEASITDMTAVDGEVFLLTQSGEIFTGCEYSCQLVSRVSSPSSSFVLANGQLFLSTFSGPQSVSPNGDQ